jgi:hypothetical protein
MPFETCYKTRIYDGCVYSHQASCGVFTHGKILHYVVFHEGKQAVPSSRLKFSKCMYCSVFRVLHCELTWILDPLALFKYFFFYLCLHIWSLLTLLASAPLDKSVECIYEVKTAIRQICYHTRMVIISVVRRWPSAVGCEHWWCWYYLQSESPVSVEMMVWISEQKGPYINVTVADRIL